MILFWCHILTMALLEHGTDAPSMHVLFDKFVFAVNVLPNGQHAIYSGFVRNIGRQTTTQYVRAPDPPNTNGIIALAFAKSFRISLPFSNIWCHIRCWWAFRRWRFRWIYSATCVGLSSNQIELSIVFQKIFLFGITESVRALERPRSTVWL